jgi:2-keto-4-pentenoate hydratase/2-oxohepta-3-ene-1,7-dioic acid hydratase in catechol pathway
MQQSNTRDMIFSVAEIIEFLSGSTTLEPGTLILTGTPEGVGMGRKPPVYLKPGDVVEIEIEGIGVLRNPVVEEKMA